MQRQTIPSITVLIQQFLAGQCTQTEFKDNLDLIYRDSPEKFKELHSDRNNCLLYALKYSNDLRNKSNSEEISKRTITLIESLLSARYNLQGFLITTRNILGSNVLHLAMQIRDIDILRCLYREARIDHHAGRISSADYAAFLTSREQKGWSLFAYELMYGTEDSFNEYVDNLKAAYKENAVTQGIVQDLLCYHSFDNMLLQGICLHKNRSALIRFFSKLQNFYLEKMIVDSDYRQLLTQRNRQGYSPLMTMLNTKNAEGVKDFCDQIRFAVQQRILNYDDIERIFKTSAPNDFTPFHQAASSGNILIVRELVSLISELFPAKASELLADCLWYRIPSGMIPTCAAKYPNANEVNDYVRCLRAKYSIVTRQSFINDRRDRSPTQVREAGEIPNDRVYRSSARNY